MQCNAVGIIIFYTPSPSYSISRPPRAVWMPTCQLALDCGCINNSVFSRGRDSGRAVLVAPVGSVGQCCIWHSLFLVSGWTWLHQQYAFSVEAKPTLCWLPLSGVLYGSNLCLIAVLCMVLVTLLLVFSSYLRLCQNLYLELELVLWVAI